LLGLCFAVWTSHSLILYHFAFRYSPVIALNVTTIIRSIIGVIGTLVVGLLIGLFTGGLFNLGLEIGTFIPWYKDKENKDVKNDHKLTKTGMQCCALGILITIFGLYIHQLFPGLLR
jgi:energy-converting hydrogenase Eha subunit A